MYSNSIEAALKKAKVSTGDRILVTRGPANYEGILMPKPEIGAAPAILSIKLSSGYNIGIKFGANVKLRKLGAGKPLEAFPEAKIKAAEGLPSVSVIATGGTISSRVAYETGGVQPLANPQQIFFLAPEIGKIVKIREIEKPFMIASEDMTPPQWQSIAKTAAKLLNSKDSGLIITHGTDTLHFTSAVLSFMLRNLNKPVVLTYSQRSTDRGSTDASINLICAAHVAAKWDGAEVVLVGHGDSDDDFCLINRGTKTRKMHTSRRDTFRPINELPLGRVWPDGKIEVINKDYRPRVDGGRGKVTADTAFERKVALVQFAPGLSSEVIDFYANSGYKGLIIAGTGLGHVATQTLNKKDSWIPNIRRAIDKGVFVGITSQCLYGAVNPNVYANLRILADTGAVYLEDILPETAYIKLGCVLGHTKKLEEAKTLMLTNLAGEISRRLDPRAFLY